MRQREQVEPDPLESLRQNAPEIAEVVDRAEAEIAQAIAKKIAHLVKAKQRFVSFLETFCPEPPQPRPQMYESLDWSKLRPAFAEIYDRRSEAVHGGVPIPWAMCFSPREEPEAGAVEEAVGALGVWSGGDAYWPASTVPMYLNTFAYIVRGSLLNWWKSLPGPPQATASGAE